MSDEAPFEGDLSYGQLTYGVHVSLAPSWFDPGEAAGIITPYMLLYGLHDALVKAMPDSKQTPSLAESYAASEDGLTHDFVLRRASFQQSMNRADNCHDNAFMESCFGTIKTELEMTEYETVRSAHGEIAEYLRYYNHQRRHSALDYLAPAQFENQQPPPINGTR